MAPTGVQPDHSPDALTFILMRPGSPYMLTLSHDPRGGVLFHLRGANGRRLAGRMSAGEFRRLLRSGAALVDDERGAA